MNLTSGPLSRYTFSIEEMAEEIMSVIAESLQVDSVYIAKKEDTYMDVLRAYNNHGEALVSEGMKVEHEASFCQYVLKNDDQEYFHFSDAVNDEETKELLMPKNFNVHTFLGVYIKNQDGGPFGTLCVLNREPREFKKEEISLMQTFGNLLSYLIRVDQMNEKIEVLGYPIVPIGEGIAVLPLVGAMDESRSNRLMETVLQEVYGGKYDYFMIDVSGVSAFNEMFTTYISQVIQALKLMGIDPILTGVRPDMAVQDIRKDILGENIMIEKSLETALKSIGFRLVRNE
ncbi:rsbT co-antagonist protein RsbR [Marinococcus luteus]|uniref:RsbT co-antagonist protein RsbR n=1 Tax=Marinococcus luteus TaxID=1122204 RepID=A0A1H2TU61_9BACI|nr:GAF domain-containing protein [Marinococcus luteus]SDW46714.1 rsbT co-antagonist protein RsbR [Marinococcus luteus]